MTRAPDPGAARRVALLAAKRRHGISYRTRDDGGWEVLVDGLIWVSGMPDLTDAEDAVLRRFGGEMVER